MRNIMLEQLFSGNIGAAHMPSYETQDSIHYSEQADKLEEQLRKSLDEQGQKLLTQLKEIENAAESAYIVGCFIHGFKLATMIMTEVFMDTESEILDKKQYWRTKNPR